MDIILLLIGKSNLKIIMLFSLKNVSVAIIISKDQEGSVFRKSCRLDFHPRQMNSFIGCVNKSGVDYLAHIKNENVLLNV